MVNITGSVAHTLAVGIILESDGNVQVLTETNMSTVEWL